MKKDELMKLGLDEETAKKVEATSAEELKGFIPKARFDEVNGEKSTLEASLKERDGQLEALKNSGGDIEGLKKQITDLQAANTEKEQAHADEIKALRFETALNTALTTAKARNPETVKPLLKKFLEKAELNDEGVIKGLNEEVKKLAEDDNTKFLFDLQTKPKPGFKGFTPGEKGDGQNTPLTFEEAIKAHYEGQT